MTITQLHPTTPDEPTPSGFQGGHPGESAPSSAISSPSDAAAPPPATPRPARDERGITTAEYAVGTAAGAGLAGLLYVMLTGGLGRRLINLLFDHVLALLGIG